MTSTKTVQAKKTSAKKSTKKVASTGTKRTLVCASGEQCFWTTDGAIISNLVELERTLGTMAEDVFMHHANRERNDFANWITDILHDSELAESFRSAKKPHTARVIVARRLKLYDI